MKTRKFDILLAAWTLLSLLACGDTGGNNTDFDGDGSIDAVDCAPSDPEIYPGAPEDCSDGIDNNCDTWTDCYDSDCEDCTGDDDDSGTVDLDGDGIADGSDNCPSTANPGQEDQDGDQVLGTEPGPGEDFGGDACDPCTDLDGDGFGAGLAAETCPVDTCPGSDDAHDVDEDAVPDDCDPQVPYPLGVIPDGAPQMYDLVRATTDTSRVYARSLNSRLYLSEDSGASWSAMVLPEAMSELQLLQVVVSPDDANLLLVASSEAHIFRSEDGGLSWMDATLPSEWTPDPSNWESWILSLSFSPVDPSRVYATTGGSEGLVSDDGGLSWALLPPHPVAGDSGAFHPSNFDAERVWWRNYSGLAESSDGGANWTQRSMPEWNKLLSVDPDIDGVLWGFDHLDLVRSDDGGQSWQIYAAAPGGYVDLLSFHPVDSSRMYAIPRGDGLWVSGDRGLTWERDNDPHLNRYGRNSHEVSIEAGGAGSFLVAAGSGILRSTDDGDNFVRSNLGLGAHASVQQVVLSPIDPQVLLARTPSAVYRSEDGGLTWIESVGTPVCDGWKRPMLAADPHTSGRWFLGCGSEGVYVSWDDGLSFSFLALPQGPSTGFGDVSEIYMHPTVPDRILGVYRGLIMSVDGGAAWQDTGVPNDWTLTLAIHPSTPSVMYLGRSGGVVLWSVDGGTTWNEPIQAPMRASGSHAHPRGISTDPDNSLRAWLHDHTDLHVTTDGGQTWSRVTDFALESIGMTSPIAVLSGETGGLVLADRSHGLRYSGDDGATWMSLSMPVVPTDYVQTGSSWLVATQESGLWRLDWSPAVADP